MKATTINRKKCLRTITLLCVIVFLFSGTTSAKIRAQSDFNNSIAYYVFDKWTAWGGENTATFVKYINASGEEKYWVRVYSWLYYRSQQYADIIINEKVFRVEQLETPQKEYLRCGFHLKVTSNSAMQYTLFNPAYTLFFDIPAELIEKMLTAQQIQIKLKHDVKEPTVLKFDQDRVKEIQEVIKLKSADFSKYVSSE